MQDAAVHARPQSRAQCTCAHLVAPKVRAATTSVKVKRALPRTAPRLLALVHVLRAPCLRHLCSQLRCPLRIGARHVLKVPQRLLIPVVAASSSSRRNKR